jgi:hypothetical protein
MGQEPTHQCRKLQGLGAIAGGLSAERYLPRAEANIQALTRRQAPWNHDARVIGNGYGGGSFRLSPTWIKLHRATPINLRSVANDGKRLSICGLQRKRADFHTTCPCYLVQQRSPSLRVLHIAEGGRRPPLPSPTAPGVSS